MHTCNTHLIALAAGIALQAIVVAPALAEQTAVASMSEGTFDTTITAAAAALKDIGLDPAQAEMLAERTGEFGRSGLMLTLQSMGINAQQGEMLLALSAGLDAQTGGSGSVEETLAEMSASARQTSPAAVE